MELMCVFVYLCPHKYFFLLISHINRAEYSALPYNQNFCNVADGVSVGVVFFSSDPLIFSPLADIVLVAVSVSAAKK